VSGLSDKAMRGLIEQETARVRELLRPLLANVADEIRVHPGLSEEQHFHIRLGITVYELTAMIRILCGTEATRSTLAGLHRAANNPEIKGLLLVQLLMLGAGAAGELPVPMPAEAAPPPAAPPALRRAATRGALRRRRG
jgi:hypothetical protein